jgi:lysophospholipase L1-like esterase
MERQARTGRSSPHAGRGLRWHEFLFCLAALVLSGCPQIDRVEPGRANVGDVIDIRDPVDGSLGNRGTVTWGGVPVPEADLLSWSPTDIFVRVPPGEAGVLTITVDTGGVPSNPASIEVLSSPVRLRVLCFGDSITYRRYPALLQAYDWGSREPAVVINQGKPAEHLVYAADRFVEVVGYSSGGGGLDFVLLMEGTNDVSDDSGLTLGAMQASLGRMLDSVPRGTRVVLGTLVPRVGDCGDVASPTTEEWNTWLEGYSGAAGIPVVDTYDDFVRTPAWEAAYFSAADCIHPNLTGHQRIAELFRSAILSLLP